MRIVCLVNALGKTSDPALFARVSGAAVFAPRVLPLPKLDDIGVCEHVDDAGDVIELNEDYRAERACVAVVVEA